jgi:toxin-antitoxin system PIN domain toxin
MLAVDTNVLVYAHRRDSPLHEPAVDLVRALAESPVSWAIPWPCVHEFLAVVTHPKIYKPASTLAQAVKQVERWTASPSLVMLAEVRGYLPVLNSMLEASRAGGGAVHEARIAALCVVHGVSELVTLDRDFGRFPELKTRSLLA